MGNILRIDVNSTNEGKAYGIPSDNPFVGKTGRDEIYAYGFRNPFRFSFDMSGSRRLLSMDAGNQDMKKSTWWKRVVIMAGM